MWRARARVVKVVDLFKLNALWKEAKHVKHLAVKLPQNRLGSHDPGWH